MINFLDVKDCYGCGLCAVVCVHEVIDIELTKDGFYQPIIRDYRRCVNCGLCSSVCSYINDLNESRPLKCYAAWSKDVEVLRTSTSGGVSYEVAKYLLSKGYTFCGVRYNSEKIRAEHYLASDLVLLEHSKGSKYLQSYTKTAFYNIDRKKKNLVVGTPCQIASFRRYINLFNCSDNFILIDFFCHGVPSYLMWQKYLKEHSKDLGRIISASWRNKKNGWRDSYCITLEGSNKSYSSGHGKDDFYTMFLGDACLGKACYDSCKFKFNRSAADIRIGDLWGDAYKSNRDGVCAVLVFSDRGDHILQEANLVLEKHSLETVTSGQLKQNPKRPWYYNACQRMLTDEKSRLIPLASVVWISKNIRGYINRLKRIVAL